MINLEKAANKTGSSSGTNTNATVVAAAASAGAVAKNSNASANGAAAGVAGNGSGGNWAGNYGSSSQHGGSGSSTKYTFRNNVQACEAIVRFLAEKFAIQGAGESWWKLWGGKERFIINALPQVKNEIRTETGALIVAMAIICCATMCLGPSLRIHDANDGIESSNENVILLQQHQNEDIEDTVGELTS